MYSWVVQDHLQLQEDLVVCTAGKSRMCATPGQGRSLLRKCKLGMLLAELQTPADEPASWK